MINDLIQISKEAGEIIRENFNKNFKVDYKSNEKDLLTEVDKLSEKHITDFIKGKYPSHGILAEESGNIKEGEEYLWVIDPLDGTVNFAHGLPVFSISIGLRKNKQTIAGVVYDIMQNVIYSAELGKGAFADSQKMRVTENANIGHALLVTGFPYTISSNPDNALGKFTSLTMAARGIRRLGSAAIDLCYVAKGVFDGFWEVFLNPWDMCAGKLIVEEAGGLVTDFDGNEMDIYSKRILATNRKIHQSMIEILKKN
jgi:myo-inositol-1(or 4)-monophosphatase